MDFDTHGGSWDQPLANPKDDYAITWDYPAVEFHIGRDLRDPFILLSRVGSHFSLWILLISPPMWTIQVQWDYPERGRHQHHINTSLPDNTTEEMGLEDSRRLQIGRKGFHAQNREEHPQGSVRGGCWELELLRRLWDVRFVLLPQRGSSCCLPWTHKSSYSQAGEWTQGRDPASPNRHSWFHSTAASKPVLSGVWLQMSTPKDIMSACFSADCKRTAASSRRPFQVHCLLRWL